MKHYTLLLLFFIQTSFAWSDTDIFPDRTRPVFHFHATLQGVRPGQMTQEEINNTLQTMIPEEYRDYMIFSTANSVAANYQKPDGTMEHYLDFTKRVDQAGIPFLFEISDPVTGSPKAPYPDNYQDADPTKRYYFTPEQVEAVFKACPNCEGVETAEVFWSYSTDVKNWLNGVLRVCKKYNKKAIIADANFAVPVWSRYFYDCYQELVVEGLGKHLIPLYKNTKPYASPQSMGALMGSWMTGVVEDYGVWNDDFQWCYYAFHHADEFVTYNPDHSDVAYNPFFMYLREYVLYAALGGRYQTIERESFGMENGFSPRWKKYMLPLLKGMYDHQLIPSRESVAAKSQLMVDPYGTYTRGRNSYSYNHNTCNLHFQDEAPAGVSGFDPYGWLYNITYAFSQEPGYQSKEVSTIYIKRDVPDYMIRDALPNESKYYQMPVLPHPDLALPEGMGVLKLNQYSSQDQLREKLDQVFTGPSTEGKAWIQDIDNSIFILNTLENNDRPQDILLDLKGEKLSMLTGSMPFMNLLVGKREETGANETYWFQSNGYSITTQEIYRAKARPTFLSFTCKEKPYLTVESGNRSNVLSGWDEEKKMLSLEIHHQDGPVNFYISSAPIDVAVEADPNEWFMSASVDTLNYGDRIDNPIQVATQEELALISHYVSLGRLKNRFFKQIRDIDLEGIEWRPIGNMNNNAPFYGEYDGDGYQIQNINVTTESPFGGLFGYIKNSSLKNIYLTSGSIKGYSQVGGIVGGAAGTCVIAGCFNGARVEGTEICVGGIVGEQMAAEFLPLNQPVDKITITNCLNTGDVIGFRGVAGIIGAVKSGVIRECGNRANIRLTRTSYCGGGIANVYNPSAGNDLYEITVKNCYNSGDIAYLNNNYGNFYGIIGTHRNGNTPNTTLVKVTYCYNSGSIKTANYNGAIVGENTSNGNCEFSVKNSYYRNGCGAVGQGTAMLHTDMKASSFVSLLNGSQSTKPWGEDVESLLNSGYPILVTSAELPTGIEGEKEENSGFNLYREGENWYITSDKEQVYQVVDLSSGKVVKTMRLTPGTYPVELPHPGAFIINRRKLIR